MNLETDIDLFFLDFSETATAGSLTFKCIFDTPDKAILDGQALSTDYQIICKTTVADQLEEFQQIVIKTKTYEVRHKELIDDGLMTKIYLGVP